MNMASSSMSGVETAAEEVAVPATGAPDIDEDGTFVCDALVAALGRGRGRGREDIVV